MENNENLNNDGENIQNVEGEGEEGEEMEEQKEKIIDPLSYIPTMPILLEILGDKFIDNKYEPIADIESEIFSAKLIGLFFNGEWGSPSRIFRKQLIDIYNKTNEGEKVFEIIEIECPKQIKKKEVKEMPAKGSKKYIIDEDLIKAQEEEAKKAEKKLEEEFKKNISIKPWKFLPYKDPRAEDLRKKYNVTSIPQFFPIDKKGNIISDNARKELIDGGADVCEEWINVLKDIFEDENKEQENNEENNNEQPVNQEEIQKEEEKKIEEKQPENENQPNKDKIEENNVENKEKIEHQESQPNESQPQESQPNESQPQESQPNENEQQESQPNENEQQESQPNENEQQESQPQESEPKEG